MRSGWNCLITCMAFAILVIAGGCTSRQISDRNLVKVDVATAQELVQGRKSLLRLGGTETAAWVDPRRPEAYGAGHIPGAISLPYEQVSNEHDRLNGYDILIVYGDDYNDARAHGMSKRLMELGHKDVRTLHGGLRAWQQEGHALERGSPSPSASTSTPTHD